MRLCAERRERLARHLCIRWLAVDTSTERHQRVDAKHHLLRPGGFVSRTRLQQRVLDRHLLGLTVLDLLYIGRTHRERHSQTLEDRPALRRGRSEHERADPAHDLLTHMLAALILVAAKLAVMTLVVAKLIATKVAAARSRSSPRAAALACSGRELGKEQGH